ncbi:MAG: hypothetical protein IPM13_11590 [Phycisphaerales bacterium]|nr:hypothetical protein [Phycisphaerales bacterium]
MNTRPLWSVSIVASVLASAALAHAARPLREASSESGAYTLRIEPGRVGGAAPCEAVLLRNVEGSPRGRKLWERPLVNEVAPAIALVRDDGRYVVTLDEFRRGGARHALVIYGPDGGLLRHFLLTDLLTGDDWPHVRISRRAITWLRDAQCGFDDRAEQFTIRLAWGRTIRVDLRSLRLLRDDDPALTRSADDAVPPQVLDLIAAASEEEDDTDEPGATATRADTAGDDVRAAEAGSHEHAAAEAEESPQAAPSHGAGASEHAGARDEAAPGEVKREHDARPTDADAARVDALADPARSTPGDSWMDVPIPQPNPANPVNYAEWLNRFGRTSGADAAVLYERAVDWFTPFDGPAELLAAAQRGEPEALASAQIVAWLECNQSAMDAFRAAARLPGRSWALPQDEPLLGVMPPNLTPLRQLARAMIVEGRRLATEGAFSKAADHFLDTISAGAHLGRGPTIIENLAGVAMQHYGAEALLDLLAVLTTDGETERPQGSVGADRAPPAARREPAEPVAALDYVLLAHRAELASRPVRSTAELARSERVMLLDALQHIFSRALGDVLTPDRTGIRKLVERNELGVEPEAVTAALAAVGWDATLADASAYFETVELAAREPLSRAVAELEAAEQSIARLRERNPLLAELLPTMSRVHLLKTRAEATRRAALLVTHLNAYRQAHGRYPDSLDALGGREFVVDPFTSTRFDYARDGESFTLSSRGATWGNAGTASVPSGAAAGTAAGGAASAGAGQRDLTGEVVYWPRAARGAK